MSDTVRSYRSDAGGDRSGLGSLFIGGARLTRYVLIALSVFGVYAFWISRDTKAIGAFVPKDTTFQLVAQDMVENRSRLQESSVWDALPEAWKLHPFSELLQTPVELPDWVQRNLVGRYVFVSGRDASEFTDAVYMTKMSRVGSVLERMLRWSGGNEGDAAGGLKVRCLMDYELYYAVRGRVALLSTSRRALIHSLTLDEEERVSEEDWDKSVWDLGNEDFRGAMQLDGGSRWGGYFSGLGFALRLEQDKGFLKLNMPCRDTFYDVFGDGLRNAAIPELLVPVEGTIQVSANFNGAAEGLWGSLGALLNKEDDFDGSWNEWMAESRPESLASYLAHTLRDAGPGVALSWHGYGMDTIVPSTDFSMVAENRNDALIDQIESLSGRSREDGLKTVDVLYDDESGWIEAVDVGGAARTAVLKQSEGGEHVSVSTSKVLAETLWTGGAQAMYMTEKANLFLQVSPGEAVERYVEYGTALAGDGLLEGYSAGEFPEYAAELRAKVFGIDLITALARHDDGVVEVDITVDSLSR